jgi:hypothetical protein
MWAIFAMLCLLAITYSRVFGAEQTRLMVLSWGLAEGQSLTLEVRARMHAALLRGANARVRTLATVAVMPTPARSPLRCRSLCRPIPVAQEPLVIVAGVLLPTLVDAVFRNELSGEIASALCVSSGVGACVSGAKRMCTG